MRSINVCFLDREIILEIWIQYVWSPVARPLWFFTLRSASRKDAPLSLRTLYIIQYIYIIIYNSESLRNWINKLQYSLVFSKFLIFERKLDMETASGCGWKTSIYSSTSVSPGAFKSRWCLYGSQGHSWWSGAFYIAVDPQNPTFEMVGNMWNPSEWVNEHHNNTNDNNHRHLHHNWICQYDAKQSDSSSFMKIKIITIKINIGIM